MNYQGSKQLSIAVVIGLLSGLSGTGHAACNDANNWFKAPGPEINVFVGYKQEQTPGFASFGVSQSPDYDPYPKPLPNEMLGKEGSGSLSKDETSDVSYYEPDGKGGWRVCRVERWWPAGFGDEEVRAVLKPITERYVKIPVLKTLAQQNVALFATLYFYDKTGRLIRLEHGDFEKPTQKATIKVCREYDDEDNLTLLLDPKNSQSCRASPPDVRDEWIRLRYGKYKGEQVELLDEWHRGSAAGRWSKDIGRFRTGVEPGAVFGAAKANVDRGVTLIYGSNAGKLDNNAANTVLNEFGKMNVAAYFFPKPPTPLEVLEKPDLIYKYERRRQTYIDGQHVKLYELFKPGEHRSRYRYYSEIGYIVRQEQFDAAGRVTRVITLENWRQPRPGPRPDVDDKLLTDKGIRIVGHQIYHRVYDFDAQGKPTLVAISWNRKLRNPLKKASVRFADLVFGTPDGKERWKSEEEFGKHFDFSPKAAQVFPDVANGIEPEHM
jgi:hypothetical protein